MLKSVLIFDSGIGGLTILSQMLKLMPRGYRFIYLADQGFFPYGNKRAKQIKNRLEKILTWATKTYQPDCLVIACNTATSLSLDQIRKNLSIPVIGVEPVVKPLANFNQALLLATKATLKSKKLKQLLAKYRPLGLSLYNPPQLAKAVEEMDRKKITRILTRIKRKFNQTQVIGLSCTHYPLIKKEIEKKFPQITIIEPSLAVAKQSQKRCRLPTTLVVSKIDWLTTGSTANLTKQIKYYLNLNIQAKLVKVS